MTALTASTRRAATALGLAPGDLGGDMGGDLGSVASRRSAAALGAGTLGAAATMSPGLLPAELPVALVVDEAFSTIALSASTKLAAVAL